MQVDGDCPTRVCESLALHFDKHVGWNARAPTRGGVYLFIHNLGDRSCQNPAVAGSNWLGRRGVGIQTLIEPIEYNIAAAECKNQREYSQPFSDPAVLNSSFVRQLADMA